MRRGNVALMLGQRRRRWANIKPASAQYRPIILLGSPYRLSGTMTFSCFLSGGDRP